MKKNILNIFIGIVILIFGSKLYNSNKGAASQDENIALYNNFCQNGVVISANIDSVNQSKNFYTHQISYSYNHKIFHQSITTNEKFKQAALEISILKNNPNDYIIGNACKNLTAEVNTGKSVLWEYLGILLIIYGVFVLLVKSMKTILASKNKYKQLSAFEKSNKRIIPNSIRKILEYQLKNNKNIEFEIPNYWTFKIINYNSNLENDHPASIIKDIEEHIQRYFYPVLNYSKIIPFATDNNYKFLFVEEGKEAVFLIDLDSADTKPLLLKDKIEHYIAINKLEIRNDKYYYNGLKKIQDITDQNKYFFDVPDCIFEGKDYFDTFAKSFNLLEKKPDFAFADVEEAKESYTLTVHIEDKSKTIKLRRYNDYIDSENFIKALNEILTLLNYNQKKYYLISNTICDFGVVLADEKTAQTLYNNGCIELNEKELKLNSDELALIRKYNDLITEIDNIEFYLKVTKDNSEIKKGLVYNFFYETKYEFDIDGIEQLKQRLNINLKKVDSGYDIYFTNRYANKTRKPD